MDSVIHPDAYDTKAAISWVITESLDFTVHYLTCILKLAKVAIAHKHYTQVQVQILV